MRDELRRRVPGRYWIWTGAASCAALGTQVAIFGLSWSAAERSPALAGGVLATAIAPRVALALLGGAAADRWGPLRTVVVSGVAAGVLALGGALFGLALSDPTWLLFAVALGLGIVTAFQLPASGALPRLLVPATALPRALAASQVTLQATTVLAAPLGGLAVGVLGLRGSLLLLAGAALTAVLLVWPLRHRVRQAPTEYAGSSHLRLIGDGLRLVARQRVIRDVVVLLVAVAGFLLPVGSLLVPLLAREHGWRPEVAGATAAGLAVGSAAVSLWVLVFGGLPRPGFAIAGGLALAATGLAALSVSTGRLAALACVGLVGVGNGLFASHAAPLVLGTAPKTHVARVQAILMVAQSLPLLASSNLIGLVAEIGSARGATLLCAGGTALAAIQAVRSPAIRRSGPEPASGSDSWGVPVARSPLLRRH
ncbi:MFS transporter [Plantactinospora sp. GCM10030261]|uniref:MFS transporter n=1 Tax=Plantactinospora sp. GCM10030261 TaxID=3273420 RepID=UPI003622EAA8